MARIPHGYLTIDLPDDWEDASQIIFLGPEEDGFRPNIVFSREPTLPGEDSAQFAQRQLPQIQEALTDYFLLSERDTEMGPNVGFLRERTFSMDKGDIGQLQFYCVMDGVAYTFTFTHLIDNLDAV